MRNLFTIFTLALCTVTGAGPALAAGTARPASHGTIVAFGDSLTAGYGVPESEAYPARLQRKLQQAGYQWTVVNAGISGETSSGALARVDWIMKLNPDIVILETGANDGLRGQDPELLHKNIDKIVSTLQSRGVVVVLAGMKMLKNLGPAYTGKFAAVYRRVARDRKVLLVPFFLDKVAGKEGLNLSDGVHPTGKGYAIVTDNVYPYLLKAIQQKDKH
ncbi:arylesterase [Geomonas subterranea]|uniref:Arylesterase n=1 Tax=Geomonas subterranea TaxID=2847989 RepID=A0ABX8LP44_9BACT|nr:MULTISPECIES: arylesterase [Geomonas]QXE92018.1 arylesterase [Geomonas subterranea]QXM09889.1 arylesterase [Geomonas subterranea]